ncbi:MAG: Ig-like domain-containing protein, partial [Planctomycetota bacterium]|nr:Ig-like domain-containing protein [Planctomycetota bacterium]
AEPPPAAAALSLTIGAPATVYRNGTANVVVGTVSLSAVAAVDTVVTLSSSDTTQATVSASVTIKRGSYSATFNITPVANYLPYDALVTITATQGASVTGSVVVKGDPIEMYNRSGDLNRFRDQGETIIDSNTITYASLTGVNVSPGDRNVMMGGMSLPGTPTLVTNLPHPAPPIAFPTLNTDRLAPGAVIVNNIITNFKQTAINIAGDNTNNLAYPNNKPLGDVPFVRVVNNTIIGANAAFQSFVNFSSIPGGTAVEGLPISNQFAAINGVSFSYSDGTFPLLAEVGDQAWGSPPVVDAFAFYNNSGVSGNDSLNAGQPSIGQFFLTDNTPGYGTAANNPDLLITYTVATAAASAQILDIDGSESWTIEALDATGAVIGTKILTPASTGAGNGKAATWSFSFAAALIKTIRLRAGTAFTGLGFANFYAFGGQGTGVAVSNNASPSILNNIIGYTQTGISFGADVWPVEGWNLFQANINNVTGAGQAASDVVSANTLFVNPGATPLGNYYLQPGSEAVDSALDMLSERASNPSDAFDWGGFRTQLDMGPSQIFAPDRDVYGQLRRNSSGSSSGGGANTSKDLGAVDRVDTLGPYLQMLNPLDNDAQGLDTDPNLTVIHEPTGLFDSFTLLLADGPGSPLPNEGTGVDGNTVLDKSIQLTQDGTLLKSGVDYTWGYSSTNNILVLTPLSGVWEPNSLYQITLANSGTYAILDRAGNKLQPNQASGLTQFTIILGTVAMDFGDAPDTYQTLLASNGARHEILPGAAYLGTSVVGENNGLVPPAADSDEDGVAFWYDLGQDSAGTPWVLPTVFNSGTTHTWITVTASDLGLLDAWVDFNHNNVFDTSEQILKSYYLLPGANVIDINLGALTTGWATGPANINTYARFRISPAGNSPVDGIMIGGEVEDYPWQIIVGTPPTPNSVDGLPDAYSVDEDTLLTVDGTTWKSVLDNDTPGLPREAKLTPTVPPLHGKLTFKSNGLFTYQPDPDFNGTDMFSYRPLVAGLLSNADATVTITVNPKNDVPAIVTVPGALSLDENRGTGPAPTVTLPQIQIFDVDARSMLGTGIGLLVYDPNWLGEVTLAAEYGTITLPSTALANLTSVSGDGTDTVVFQGSLDSLNAALNGIRYQGKPHYNSGDQDTGDPLDPVRPDLLTVHVDDLSYTDIVFGTPVFIARATIPITVNPKQDPPTLTVPASAGANVNEDSILAFAGRRNEVQTVTFDPSVDGGAFTLTYGGNLTTANIVWDVTPNVLTLVANLQTGLDGIFGAGNTLVASQSSTVYTITFQGTLTDANLPQLTASSSTTKPLTGAAPSVATSTLAEGRGNAVQTLTLGGTNGGTITLSYQGVSGSAATALTYTAAPVLSTYVTGIAPTAEQVLAHLNSIAALNGNVDVVGPIGGPFTLVFGNALTGSYVPLVGATASNAPTATVATSVDGGGLNEVQRLTFAPTVNGGGFTLTYGGNLTTVSIPWNITPATLVTSIQNALNTVFGAGNTLVASSSPTVYTITFQNGLGSANLTQLTANIAGLAGGAMTVDTVTEGTGNEVQLLAVSGTSGSFRLSYSGANASSAIPVITGSYASLLASGGTGATGSVENNLNTIPALNGKVTVIGANGGPYSIVFNGVPLAGTNVSLLGVGVSGATSATVTPVFDGGARSEVQQLTLGGVITGGTFTLTFGSNLTTGDITWSGTASTLITNIQAALDAIFGATNTLVASPSSNVYTIAFQNALANANLPQLTASSALLTGAAPTVIPSTVLNGTGNEVQTLTLAGTADGTLTLSYDDGDGSTVLPLGTVTSGAAQSFSSAAPLTVAKVVAGLPAPLSGKVAVLGATGGPFTIVFGSTLGNKNIRPLSTGFTGGATAIVGLVTDGGGLDEVQALTFDGATTAGVFQLQFGSTTWTTANITWSATPATLAANIQAALTAPTMFGAGNALVAQSLLAPNTYTITFTGTLANSDLPQLTVVNSTLDGSAPVAATAQQGSGNAVQTLTLGGTLGGTVTLSYGNQVTTFASPYSLAALQTALQLIPALWDNVNSQPYVTVLGPQGGPFTIVFNHFLAGTTVTPLVAAGIGLTTATVASSSPGLPVITVADPDQPYDPDWLGQVTLTVVHGSLSLTSPPVSATFAIELLQDRALVFHGLLVELNTALQGLVYRPDPNYNSGDPDDGVTPDPLTVTISDLGNVGTPTDPLAALTATRVIAITVNPVQDAPAVQGPDAVSVNEDINLTLAGRYSEVQQLTLDTSGGAITTFTLSYGGGVTATVDWDADPSVLATKIQTALSALLDTNGVVNVVVALRSWTGTVRQYTVTLRGELADANVPQVTATVTSPPSGAGTITPLTLQDGAGNEVQFVILVGPAGSTFNLSYNGAPATGSLNGPATSLTALQVQTYLRTIAALQPNNVSVWGANTGFFMVVFHTGRANVDVPTLGATATPGLAQVQTYVDGGTNETQLLTFDSTVSGGSFTLTYGSNLTTGAIAWNGAPNLMAANIQNALDGLFGTGNALVAFRSDRLFSVTFNGLLGNQPQPTVTSSLAGGTVRPTTLQDGAGHAVRTLWLTGAAGSVNLDTGGAPQTLTFPYTQAKVQASLDALLGAGSATALGILGGPFTVVFKSGLAGTLNANGAGGTTAAVTTIPDGLPQLAIADIDQPYDPDWLGLVTVSVVQGSLTLTNRPVSATFKIDVGSGANDRTMTFEGTFAELNAALQGLVYRGDRDYNSGDLDDLVVPDQLTITVNDRGNTDLTLEPQRGP